MSESCINCSAPAVAIAQHGPLCKTCFLSYFEEKAFQTIREFNLIGENDKLCVAASGGKDSLSLLYILKKYLAAVSHQNSSLSMFALAVDEGIHEYRSHTLEDLKNFCTTHKINLEVVSFKQEFGCTLDEMMEKLEELKIEKKPCTPCGISVVIFSINMLAQKAQQSLLQVTILTMSLRRFS